MERKYKLALPFIIFASYVTLVQLGIPQSVGILKASNFIGLTSGEIIQGSFEYTYQLRWNFQCTGEDRDGFKENVASALHFSIGEGGQYLLGWPDTEGDYLFLTYNPADLQFIFCFSRELSGEEKAVMETMRDLIWKSLIPKEENTEIPKESILFKDKTVSIEKSRGRFLIRFNPEDLKRLKETRPDIEKNNKVNITIK